MKKLGLRRWDYHQEESTKLHMGSIDVELATNICFQAVSPSPVYHTSPKIPIPKLFHQNPLKIYFLASFGNPSRPSFPCLPTPLKSAPPSCLTPLPLVAGSLKPVDDASPVEMSDWRSPEETLTVRASAEFQSDATGGSSGRGRLL